jgi:SAM-dependent methyltransferase
MTSTVTQHIICPVCQNHLMKDLAQKIPYPPTGVPSENQQRLLQEICFCPTCHVGIALPILDQEQVDRLYADGDYWQNNQVKVFTPQQNPGQYAMACARWQYIEQAMKEQGQESLSVLDVGGGYGYLGMAAAQSLGKRLKKFAVVEKDKFFRQSLALTWKTSYPNILFQIEENVEALNDRYDVIVFSHILEHLPAPQGILQEALAKLSNDGVVFVDVPYQDFLFKDNVFPHVLFYTPDSLKQMLERLGLEVVSVGCFGRDRKMLRDKHSWNNKWMTICEHIVYKARRILPLSLSVSFFDSFFMNRRTNPDGTWIRILAKKKGRL